jgi:hypothetical protein
MPSAVHGWAVTVACETGPPDVVARTIVGSRACTPDTIGATAADTTSDPTGDAPGDTTPTHIVR